ncbi:MULTISPECIES: GNAT family N-acetyltransferase [unclassified Sedimentibacter]|uniref:GNAT family N-acetyltransferase n=1 Tax=unclassified Sedimentibacter TaxID=2649220 RepID=UPI0027DF9519|nr:N-acetyltransferase [Sedimentibacter sp. MB35-C1]WMJ77119.1 N-acetyltransferase [Sedimentibacter sp. MB35-C1]
MNTNDYIIRLETPADYQEVENLIREAFWNVYRPGCLEHYVLHCYRDRKDFVPELDFVMEKDGKIIGHIMFVHAKIQTDNSKELPIMTFGPISIAPQYKRQGYGKALLDYAMEQAKSLGCGALCMEGNIDFYGKSGFVVASTKGIHYYAEPKDAQVPYFLLKELKQGFLDGISGTYHTPDGYFVDEKEAELFDAHFPPKTKLKLPGQLV